MPPLMAARPSAHQDFEQNARQLAGQAEQIIQTQTQIDMIWENNGLGPELAALEPGAQFGDSSYTKEHAAAVHAMLESFKVWLRTPLQGIGLTPLQIIFRR